MQRIFVIYIFFCSNIFNYVYSCQYNIVETIPEGMNYKAYDNETYKTFYDLITTAKKSIYISSFYWSLKCNDTSYYIKDSCYKGEKILKEIIDSLRRGVQIYIVNNDNELNKSKKRGKKKSTSLHYPDNHIKSTVHNCSKHNPKKTFDFSSDTSTKSSNILLNQDLAILQSYGANIRLVNIKKFFGYGVLHTKFIVSDNESFYLGSSNMDWRSLSQVKELGITIKKCPSLAKDLLKIFEIYWFLGSGKIMSSWPKEWDTNFNRHNPLNIKFNSFSVDTYLTSSPKKLATINRTVDINGLIDVINSAEKYINIEVMNYSPTFQFTNNILYWPKIDNALRSSVINRNIQVKIIVADWIHTNCDSLVFLNSLNDLSLISKNRGIEVKLLKIPSNSEESKIPYSRVNHDKFIVTDKQVFIGTSNWSGDYFHFTAGVSFIGKNFKNFKNMQTIKNALDYIFFRDWNSVYAQSIYKVNCKK